MYINRYNKHKTINLKNSHYLISTIFILSLLIGIFFNSAAQAAGNGNCSWNCYDPYKYKTADEFCATKKQQQILGCFGKSLCNPPAQIEACCCDIGTAAFTDVNSKIPAILKLPAPTLQIAIPGLTYDDVNCPIKNNGSYTCRIPWMSQYIVAIYRYGLGIAGILAAIILMAGGLLWLASAGDSSKIAQAKEMMISSVTGLIILFSSYVILYKINPDLVAYTGIIVDTVKAEDLPEPVDTAAFSEKCKPQTTGACAVANMSAFGARAEQASAICNAESGGNPGIYNSLTKCTNGGYAVWGLFQFNLSANDFIDSSGTTLHCYQAFTVNGKREAWSNKHPSCTISDFNLYNKCVKAASDPSLSIKNAVKLTSARNWGPWESNSKWCHFQ